MYLLVPSVCLFWFNFNWSPSRTVHFASRTVYFGMHWTIPITCIPSISLIVDFRFFDSTFSWFRFFLFWTFWFWRFFGWRFFRRRVWSWPRAWSRPWFLRRRVGCRRYHTLIGQSFWISLWSFVILVQMPRSARATHMRSGAAPPLPCITHSILCEREVS